MAEEIDLRQCWEIIRKRWQFLVILPLVAALISGIVSCFFLKPVYQSSTTLIVGKKAQEEGQAAIQMLDASVLQANLQLAKTYAAIAKSRTVEQNVINKLDLPLTVGELDKLISVNLIQSTEILEIQVKNTDPGLAAAIANTLAQEFSKAVINIKKVDSVSIVDSAVIPNVPVKPNKQLNVLIAFIIGLIAAAGLVFLLDFLDNTVKTENDVEDLLEIPVIGVIPSYDTEKKGRGKRRRFNWHIH